MRDSAAVRHDTHGPFGSRPNLRRSNSRACEAEIGVDGAIKRQLAPEGPTSRGGTMRDSAAVRHYTLGPFGSRLVDKSVYV